MNTLKLDRSNSHKVSVSNKLEKGERGGEHLAVHLESCSRGNWMVVCNKLQPRGSETFNLALKGSILLESLFKWP